MNGTWKAAYNRVGESRLRTALNLHRTLLLCARHRGATIREVSVDLTVSLKTARRYVKALEQIYPIYSQRLDSLNVRSGNSSHPTLTWLVQENFHTALPPPRADLASSSARQHETRAPAQSRA